MIGRKTHKIRWGIFGLILMVIFSMVGGLGGEVWADGEHNACVDINFLQGSERITICAKVDGNDIIQDEPNVRSNGINVSLQAVGEKVWNLNWSYGGNSGYISNIKVNETKIIDLKNSIHGSGGDQVVVNEYSGTQEKCFDIIYKQISNEGNEQKARVCGTVYGETDYIRDLRSDTHSASANMSEDILWIYIEGAVGKLTKIQYGRQKQEKKDGTCSKNGDDYYGDGLYFNIGSTTMTNIRENAQNTLNGKTVLSCDAQEWRFDRVESEPDGDFIPISDSQVVPGSVTPSGNNGDNTTKDCWQGAGALGFPLCPILDGLHGAVRRIYDDFVEPALKLDTILLNTDSQVANNGTYQAWSMFRNIANIIFVILILVVIFSQLTGVGIDNYGIKKILPKLIIAAVLINLSFIICQAAVDLSNILGSELKQMMDFFGKQITDQQPLDLVYDQGTEKFAVSIGTGTSAVVALASGVGVVGWFASMKLAGLFVLLVALLGIVITFLVFFLLLAVRKAGVVLLVVIAPLAFVCYMLPNTKGLFDKWFKALKGLLLLYPICGFVMGAADFASRLLLTIGNGNVNFFAAATAMIVGIAPFFFIPTLLRNSMAALGNIGAKISGIGGKVSQRTTGAIDRGIRNTQAFKDYEANRQINKGRRIDQWRIGRLGKRSNLSERQMRALSRAQSRQAGRDADLRKIYEDNYDRLSRGELGGTYEYKSGELSGGGGALNRAFAGTNENEAIAAINIANSKGMNEELAGALYTAGENLLGGDSNKQRRAFEAMLKSDDRTISTYAKDQLKQLGLNKDVKSFKDYVKGKGNGDNILANAINKIGSNAYNGANEDTLEFLNKLNPSMLNEQTLLQGARNAADDKSLGQYNEMIKKRLHNNSAIFNSFGLNSSDFSKLDLSTIQTILSEIPSDNITAETQTLYDMIEAAQKDSRIWNDIDSMKQQELQSFLKCVADGTKYTPPSP